jgi:hypothetical protein
MNQIPANGGGYTDWRFPTVAEVQEAIANGLNSHLDFFQNGNPDDGVYRWTACTRKIKSLIHRYTIRFTDGDLVLLPFDGFHDAHILCVRGAPADTANDCPLGPGKKKNRSGATNALSQTTTGTLLLLPLAVVLAARYLRQRRP